ETSSNRSLDSLICGAVVLMNHAELVCESKQTFRVAHKEITLGIKTAIELVDQALLLGFIEVDHYVAAENHVVALRQELGLEIVKVEVNELLHTLLQHVTVAELVEVAQAEAVVDRLHLQVGVRSFLGGAERGITDIRSQNLDLPRRWDQRLRCRHFEGQRVAKIVVSQCVRN